MMCCGRASPPSCSFQPGVVNIPFGGHTGHGSESRQHGPAAHAVLPQICCNKVFRYEHSSVVFYSSPTIEINGWIVGMQRYSVKY